MKKFGGKVFFIDRDNVNTDEIIPAKYLTYIDMEPLKPHLLEDLKLEGYNPETIYWSEYGAIISRSNFGSGSSREMAVWAFEVNDIYLIIAANFARIFRENCFNRGVLAIELGDEKIGEIFDTFNGASDVFAEVDLDKEILYLKGDGKELSYKFTLNDFQRDLVRAGGWVRLAQEKY